MTERRGIPPALQRVGITAVSDDLPDGARLDVAGDFVRVFREQIAARMFKRPGRPLNAAESGAIDAAP